MKVTGFVLRGNGATITFEDGKVYELVYGIDFMSDTTLSQEYRDAIRSYIDSSQKENIDPRFDVGGGGGSGSLPNLKVYKKSVEVSDWDTSSPPLGRIIVPASEHGLTEIYDAPMFLFDSVSGGLYNVGTGVVLASGDVKYETINYNYGFVSAFGT